EEVLVLRAGLRAWRRDAHVRKDRALTARGDHRVRDPLHPDARPRAGPTLVTRQRLDPVDPVRPDVLAEAEEHHLRHGVILEGGAQSFDHTLLVRALEPRMER